MLPALIKEERAVAVISAINAAAAAYILWLYLQFGGGAGGALVALGVAATIATSIYAAVKKTEEAMWKMYKASSPMLTLFLIALMIQRYRL